MNTLLAALINGFVVSVPLAAVVWLALGVSRRWVNAATRYAVWSILLALVVCLPFRYVPLRPSPHYARVAATPAALPAAAIAQAPSVPSRPSRPVHADTPRFPLRVAPGSWSVWVMTAWVIAAFFMLLRLFVSYALLWKMKRNAADAPEVIAAAAQSALRRLGVSRRVRVAVVNDAVSPMVAGPFRPTILLPAVMLESMDEAEIAQICLHEAAHLARRDDWALMAQRLIEVVFALHPLVRWIAAQINLEREIACDNFVISVTGSARPYAACLTRIAEMARGFSGSPAAAAVSDERSHLTRRVETLLDKTRHAGARLLGARLAMLACGLALVTFLAARTPAVVAFAAAPRTFAARPAVLIAQAGPPARTPATPATTSATIQAGPAAPLVRIAVSVLDPMNRFVTGLEPDAFHVFENGVERKIVDFTARAEPVRIVVVWDDNGELRELRSRVSELRKTYMPQFPEIRSAEARIAEIESGVQGRAEQMVAGVQSVLSGAPGSTVSVIRVAENESIMKGQSSAARQLRDVAPEKSAVVLVLDSVSWPAGQIASVNGYGFPVYALGTASSASSAAALPALVSASGVAGPYPIVAADRVPASLAALATQLVNQYLIGYVSGGVAEPGAYAAADVLLTSPVGLPHLTARVSSGYFAQR